MKYSVKMRVIALLTLISMVFSVFTANAGDWTNEWVNNFTYTGPNSFHGSNRTYLNGGSFHARWGDTGVEPIFTSQAPKIKAGCGGIDAFMGSFAFLDFGRLVQKFKKMSTGAVAAFAFDIALNVLCTPCSNALKALEALSNALNSLQMGDCMSVKDIKTSLTNFGTQMGNAKDSMMDAKSDLNSGWTGGDWKDTWDDVKSASAEAIGMNPDGTWADLTADCNQSLKTFFQEEGSLLSLFAKDNSQTVLAGSANAGADLVRGYLGDLYVEPTSSGEPHITHQPACQTFNIDEFITGDYKTQPPNPGQKCVDANKSITYKGVTSTTDGLLGMTDKLLRQAVTELKTPTAIPSAAVGSFLGQVPTIPIAFIIWYAWTEPGTDQATVENIALQYKHDIAKIYAYSALTALFTNTYKATSKGWNTIELAMAAKSGSSSGSASSTPTSAPTQGGSDSDKCQTSAFKKSIVTTQNWLNGENTNPGALAILLNGIRDANVGKTAIEKDGNYALFTEKWDKMKADVRDKVNGSVYSRITKNL
jgi:conjugative transfer pilus assembly protein TraH